MTTQSPGPTLSFTISRVMAASPEQVFKAFTDPEWYSQWWGPEGTRSKVTQLDLEVGGAYRVDMVLPDGTETVLYGTYMQIEPPKLLAYSFAWEGLPDETLVTVELEPHADGTELTVTHEGFADQERADQHEHGWVSSVDRLERLVTGNS